MTHSTCQPAIEGGDPRRGHTAGKEHHGKLPGCTQPDLAARSDSRLTLLGRLFESLIALSLRVYARAAEADVYHLRTQNGDHAVDFIIERDDHRIVALEAKFAANVSESDVAHLHWLHREIGDDLIDAAVIYSGHYAYRRADGIAVIPAAMLVA